MPEPATRWRRARTIRSGSPRWCRIRRCSRCPIAATERKDDVKLGQALNKLADEDPSITIVHNPDTHEVILWGQGEMHLRVAAERLTDRFGIAIEKRQAERRLSRDDQEAGPATRPPQEAVRRTRPVRRRGARRQAAAARLGLPVRREHHRRRGAAQLHPVGRGRCDRRPEARTARLPGGRSRGHADRRLLPHRRFLGSGVPHRRPHRRGRGAAAMPAGAARADPSGRDRVSERCDGEDQRDPVGAARPDSRLRHPRGLAGLGLRARR